MPKKPIEELLGDDLCVYCPLPKELQGVYSTPSGNSCGCEGSHCEQAYEKYLESDDDTEDD